MNMKQQYSAYQDELTYLKEALTAGDITQEEYKRAREFLRGMLGTAYITNMQWVMNLNAFEHIMNQRLDRHAQPETRLVARKMLQEVLLAEVAPKTIMKMIEVNGWKYEDLLCPMCGNMEGGCDKSCPSYDPETHKK